MGYILGRIKRGEGFFLIEQAKRKGFCFKAKVVDTGVVFSLP